MTTSAPSHAARSRRSAIGSTAITLAPAAFAKITPASPNPAETEHGDGLAASGRPTFRRLIGGPSPARAVGAIDDS